jgi:hypothetical protein
MSKIGGFKMRPYCENARLYLKVSIATLLGVFATTIAIAQDKDLPLGVTYVCNGERMFIEWGQAVQLKPGPNALALDLRNATPVN